MNALDVIGLVITADGVGSYLYYRDKADPNKEKLQGLRIVRSILGIGVVVLSSTRVQGRQEQPSVIFTESVNTPAPQVRYQ